MKYRYENDGMHVVHKEHIKGLIRFFYNINKISSINNIYVVLDSAQGDEENKELFEDYKKGREKDSATYKNFDKFISVLATLSNITIVKNDRREADSVIAFLALKTAKKDQECIIYSGDKDFLQLTAIPNIKVSDKYEKGNFITLTDEEIFNKFKNSKKESFLRISNNKRDLLKYRTFKGDSSDKIPSAIPRLLDKDIKHIINNYWLEDYLNEEVFGDIHDRAYSDANNTKLHDKLVIYKEAIFRNYKLMNLFDTIKDTVIIKQTKRVTSSNNKQLESIIKEFDLSSYIGEL